MADDISLTWVDVAACLAEKYGKRAFDALADLCANDVAADEIVRLRAVLDAERALADQLAVALLGTTSGHVIPTDDEWDEIVKMRAAALDAWEARRG